MDENPGTSVGVTENSLTFKSKLNELIDTFNTKSKESLQDLHFSTIALRNKLFKGFITNNCPIITRLQLETMQQCKLGWAYTPSPVLLARYEVTCIKK